MFKKLKINKNKISNQNETHQNIETTELDNTNPNIKENSYIQQKINPENLSEKNLKKDSIIPKEKSLEIIGNLNKLPNISTTPSNANTNLDLNSDYILNKLKVESDNSNYDKIRKIKEEIDKKNKILKKRGITIKAVENVKTSLKRDEHIDKGIKKIFISEIDLTTITDPEEYKKLVGIKKEEIDSQKEFKRQQIIEHQKDLFTLPDDLRVTPQTKNDYVENLIRLSAAGLIEVPLSLENKLRNIEETEVMKKQIIDKRMAEELDYLKVLKKLGPSYAKGYKSDLSHKKLTKLNNVFGNVFVNLNGRKRKLLKEKMILDNRMMESSYLPDKSGFNN